MGLSTRSILAVALALVVAAWVGVTLKSKASVGVGLRNDRSTNAAESREPKDERIDLDRPEPADTAQRVDALSGRGRTGALDIELHWWDGSPAPDVGIEILPRSERQPFQHIVHERTDTAGRVHVASIQPGPITIEVDRACGQDGQTNVVVAAGLTQHVLIHLPRLLDVEGRVVDRDGQPVSGATVFATRDQPMAQGESIAQSGADGKYFIRSIDRGFSLFASAPGKGSSETVLLKNQFKEEDSPLSLDLQLNGSTTELVGRIIDPDDLPVSEARVRVWCVPSMNDGEFVEHAPFVIATDVNGEFRASGLSSSGVEVLVDARGHPLWHGTTHLAEGEEHRIDVRLERGVTITGSVIDEKGRPVEGAKIRQVLESRWEHFVSICTSTNADGTFRLDQIAPGTISLSAEPDTKNTSFRPTVVLEGKPGAELRWDLRLMAGVTIRGRVEDESGAPLVGWRVEGVPLAEGIRTFPKPTRTDDAGEFELRGCAPTAYRVSAYAPNERKPRCRLDEVTPGGVDCVLVVEASSRPSAVATGRLLDADGTPVVGATVAGMRTDLGESGGYDKTNSDGRFRVGPMPPAKYLFHFERGNRAVRFVGPVDLRADEEIDLGDVPLERPGRVELRLHRPDGVPFRKGFGVWLIDEHGFGSIADTKDGVLFVRGSLLPGDYRLECFDDGVATIPAHLMVRAGETTQYEATLPRGSVRELLFHPPAEGSHPKVIHVVVRGSGEFVLERDCILAPRQPKQPNEETYGLPAGFVPGHYTYEVDEAYGLHASGDFDVGDSTDDAPPLEIELQRDR